MPLRLITPLALLCLCGPAAAQFPIGIGGEGLDQGFDVAVKPGSLSQIPGVVVVGEFRQTVDFNPAPNEYLLTANGTRDGFVASYSHNAGLDWAFNLGGPGVDSANGVDIDFSGNVYVVGTFRQSVDFDPSEAEHILTSSGQTYAYLASYTANGDFRWAIQIGGADFDQGNAVVVSGDRVCATGSFQGTADLDPSDNELTFTSAGSYSIWIGCYGTEDRSLIWGYGTGGPGNFDRGWAITASDWGGDLYVTGDFTGEDVQFDPAGEADPVTALGVNDVFVVSYTMDGEFRWVHRAGSAANDIGNRGNGIAFAESGMGSHVFVTGDIIGSADFPGGEVLEAGNERAIFIAAFDHNGSPQWARMLPSAGPGRGTGLATLGILDMQIVALTGYFEGSLDLESLGGGMVENPGGRSGFVASIELTFGPTPFISEVTVLGGPANDQPNAVAGAENGYGYVTGWFGETMVINGAPITAVGARDIFLSQHWFQVYLPSIESGPTASGPTLRLEGPNPFGHTTEVSVQARRPGPVEVAVFDVLGRRVTVLFDEVLTPDQSARLSVPTLSPGVYVVRAADATGVSAVRVTRVR